MSSRACRRSGLAFVALSAAAIVACGGTARQGTPAVTPTAQTSSTSSATVTEGLTPQLATVTAATATPLPTDSGPDATATAHFVIPFVQFGFRVVLSGPASARAGENISYMLDYERVSPNPKGSDNGIVILYGLVNYSVPPERASSLISVQAVAGEPPTLTPQLAFESLNIEFVGDSGRLQIIVLPTMSFSGPLTIEAYIKGTSIEFPSGSISEVTTQITPP